MSQSEDRPQLPKSMRQKRILDLAEKNPDASLEELAEEVPSATIDLVRNVLEEHGDPAEQDENESATADQSDSAETEAESDQTTMQHMDTAPAHPDLEDLSSGQRDVLEAIVENPDASQRELAEQLGVSAATISNRANSITGFEWENRESFAKAMLEDTEPEPKSDSNENIDQKTNGYKQIDELAIRIAALEQEVHKLTDDNGKNDFDEPELVHKIAHACMQYDDISQDEELRILESFMR